MGKNCTKGVVAMLDDRVKIYEVEHLIHKLIAHEIVSIHIQEYFLFAVE